MEFGTIFKGAASVLQNFSKTQLAVLGLTMTITVGGIGTGGYLIYNHFHEPQEIAAEVLETETETEEIVAAVTEETETETETEAEAEPVEVTLVGSSIEKDLKIKVQDKDSHNIKDEAFSISVKPKKGKEKESIYEDDDHDGIIHIKDISGGEYVVALQEIEGYYTKEESYTFAVKEKIEYTKVEVSDEIKKESEVAPAEDAQEVAEAPVENEVKDTVERLETDCKSTAVAASSLNKDKYTSGKATLGTAVTVTLSKTKGAQALVTFTYRNPWLVRTGSEGQPSEGGNGNSESQSGDQTTEVSYTITHVFYENGTQVKTEEQKGTGKVGDKIPITSYVAEGYSTTSDTSELVLTAGENLLTIEWKKETPKKVSYTITHTFSDNASGTVEQSGEGNVGDKIPINSYAEAGYTNKSGVTELVLADGENKITIQWEKSAAANPTATVSMAGTGELFISQNSAANTLTLEVKIEDNNETKIVDAAGIKWSLKDDSTAGAALSATTGQKISLSAKSATKEGTVTVVATIPYTISGEKKEATLECKATVKKDTYDGTKVLTDDAGKTLYTDEKCTTVATVADLVEKGTTTFYKDPKYIGWQTLGGKLYYYNSNNVPVTGQQIISGITYTFGSDGALIKGTTATGIDVSKWQGTIDWPTVKAAGIEFAIIRVGYRGSKTGVLVEDPTFKQNIEGATKAGLKVGVYFFTQAITEAEAVEEASMALSLTKNYNLAFPIFVDTENGSGNARANGLDKATRTACVSAFCKTIQNSGRTAGVYASKSWYKSKLNTDQLNSYCIWVAQYNTTCTYTGKYNIWQYTQTGRVPGIKGNVDLNISYM